MQQYRLNDYNISQVGPRVNPDYPIYRSGRLDTPAIETDDWDEFRNNFAGGMLNGYQIIPKQKPSYGGMLGTAENQALQSADLTGLLGNAAQPDPSAPVSQVVATQPTDTWVAEPVDPGTPVAPEAPVGSGLTNRDYLMMMTGGVAGQREGETSENWEQAINGWNRGPDLNNYRAIFGDGRRDMAAETAWLDAALDRDAAQKMLANVKSYNSGKRSGYK